jgi:large subunit ribosomal protein L5
MAETAYVPRLREQFDKEIRGKLTEQFGYANVMQVPRLDKVVLNMGVGEAVNDRKKAETAAADLALIGSLLPDALAEPCWRVRDSAFYLRWLELADDAD